MKTLLMAILICIGTLTATYSQKSIEFDPEGIEWQFIGNHYPGYTDSIKLVYVDSSHFMVYHADSISWLLFPKDSISTWAKFNMHTEPAGAIRDYEVGLIKSTHIDSGKDVLVLSLMHIPTQPRELEYVEYLSIVLNTSHYCVQDLSMANRDGTIALFFME